MIPDEAVEAAVHAYMQYPRTRGLDNTENMFRAALEAAAPFMRQAFFLEMNLRAVKEELSTPFRKAT